MQMSNNNDLCYLEWCGKVFIWLLKLIIPYVLLQQKLIPIYQKASYLTSDKKISCWYFCCSNIRKSSILQSNGNSKKASILPKNATNRFLNEEINDYNKRSTTTEYSGTTPTNSEIKGTVKLMKPAGNRDVFNRNY